MIEIPDGWKTNKKTNSRTTIRIIAKILIFKFLKNCRFYRRSCIWLLSNRRILATQIFLRNYSSENLILKPIDLLKCYLIIKIPCNRSLFHENKFLTDFREKAEIFNSFFAKQYSLRYSSSSFLPEIIKKRDNALYSARFFTEYISNVINN